MNDWDGRERRQDDIRERLGIVEHSNKDHTIRIIENHVALENLYKNISELKMMVGDEVRAGNREVVKLLNEHEDKRVAEYFKTQDELTKIRTDHKWLGNWVAGTWAAIVGMAGFVILKDK